MPVTGSSPIVASQRPSPPARSPFRRASPLSEATKVMPSTASMKNSGEPRVSTSGRTMGIASPRTRAPNTAPMSELIIAAPRARPASPFFAMAWPSTMVAAVVGSPGIPNRMDVMSPVVGDRQHPQQEGERLDRRHLEDERQHEGEGRRAPEPGQETHDEAEDHADQHQPERRPGEDLDESRDAGVKKVGDRRASLRRGCYHAAA